MEDSAGGRSAPLGARIVVPGTGAVNPFKCTMQRVATVPSRPEQAVRGAPPG